MEKLDLYTLLRVEQMFRLHSDTSTMTNGYRSLCDLIQKESLDLRNKYLQFQLCPKCNGQGTVCKPPHIAGDVFNWISSESQFVCDVCDGKKVLSTNK